MALLPRLFHDAMPLQRDGEGQEPDGEVGGDVISGDRPETGVVGVCQERADHVGAQGQARFPGHAPHHLRHIQHSADLRAHAQERFTLYQPLFRLGMEASILDGDRGLIREGAGGPDVFGVERPPGLIPDAESPDDAAVHHQGNREDRAIPGRLDLRSELGSHEYSRIGEHVGGDHALPFADGEAHRAHSRPA